MLLVLCRDFSVFQKYFMFVCLFKYFFCHSLFPMSPKCVALVYLKQSGSYSQQSFSFYFIRCVFVCLFVVLCKSWNVWTTNF